MKENFRIINFQARAFWLTNRALTKVCFRKGKDMEEVNSFSRTIRRYKASFNMESICLKRTAQKMIPEAWSFHLTILTNQTANDLHYHLSLFHLT